LFLKNEIVLLLFDNFNFAKLKKMKRLKFLFISTILFSILLSCSKESEKGYANANIKGLWKASNYEVTVSANNEIVEEFIKYWMGNPINNPQGTANMFYFDGDDACIEGFEDENGDLDVIDRTYFSYAVKDNTLSIINQAGNSIDMRLLSVTTNEFRSFADMTDFYRNKAVLKEILENSNITNVDVDSIVVNKVAAISKYTKVK